MPEQEFRDDKESEAYAGFRMAKGNRFHTVLDSYVYLMAVLGTSYDEYTNDDGAWMCLLVSDNFLYDAMLLARMFGLHHKHLGLTDSEMAELSSTGAIVVIEDASRLVECNYFVDFEDAWELMDELYCVGISTTTTTQRRLDKSNPKPRKKSKKAKIRITEDSEDVPAVRLGDFDPTNLIGANYD